MSNTVDYGIDLGTSNSCIAYWESGAVRVFQNNDQMNVTPSAVHILKSGRVIVGRRASGALLTDPNNVAVEFKRRMGQKATTRFAAANRDLSAEELSAEILKALREDVRRLTGATVTASVITVPAAFGSHQCEATARAAALAGLEEAPLLQEPIAAAIGYGARPGSAGQRWLVFDLGGGTLDVAVVSTRDGRLNILEHRGNNLLGGSDIDRLIVERALLPALDGRFDLRGTEPTGARARLLPRLRIKAEEAKIDLSASNEVVVSLFDVGDDDSGEPIELEVTLTRKQLDGYVEPLFERCCVMAEEALTGARVSGKDLDKILLVGGPTQTPLLRSMLGARLQAPVDFSVDPMTVVGRGAAVYASSLERAKKTVSTPAAGAVRVKLAYEPVSSDLQTTVAGRVMDQVPGVEVKIDSAGGLWTSGWMKPRDGIFETPVSLKESDVTTFWVYVRDAKGRLLDTDAPEFTVRHGLVPSAPPLPHTVSVEVIKPGGQAVLDAVFAKGTPLPAEKTVKYRATNSLVPNKPDSTLAIKLWEGEFLEDPEANEWVGHVLLPHDGVRRTVPEGTEIEVTLRVDSSRLITVEAFVPYVNQHFSGRLYVAQREEHDLEKVTTQVATEAQEYRSRLEELEQSLPEEADATTRSEVEEVRRSLDELESRVPGGSTAHPGVESDDARRAIEDARKVRGRLGKLERSVAGRQPQGESRESLEAVEIAAEVVGQFGSSLEKQQLAMLKREIDRAVSKGDDKGGQRAVKEIDELRWRVLFKQDWFWREMFESLARPGAPLVNATEARSLVLAGRSAIAAGDGEKLREAVRGLWNLQPKDKVEASRESAVRSGLRRF